MAQLHDDKTVLAGLLRGAVPEFGFCGGLRRRHEIARPQVRKWWIATRIATGRVSTEGYEAGNYPGAAI
jgi:hypothetical protein